MNEQRTAFQKIVLAILIGDNEGMVDGILGMGTATPKTDRDKLLEDVKAKPKFAELPDRDPGEHWYDSIKLASSISKKGKKKHTDRLHSLAHKHFDAYIESTGVSVSDKAKKLEKAAVYVDGLLKNGGPSTDVFKKSLGEEKTAQLFRNVLFGITR